MSTGGPREDRSAGWRRHLAVRWRSDGRQHGGRTCQHAGRTCQHAGRTASTPAGPASAAPDLPALLRGSPGSPEVPESSGSQPDPGAAACREVIRRRAGPDRRVDRAVPGRGARAGRRERRGQVHAGEDPRGRAPAGRRDAAGGRPSPRCTARRRPARPGSRSSTRNRPCFPTCPWRRTCSSGRQPLRLRPAHRPAGDARRGSGDIRPARGPARPGADRARPVHRGPAGRRDRQGHLAGGAGHRDGRADGRALGRRGGPALRRGADAARGRARRSCSSRTGSRRSSRSASGSP